MGQFKLTHYPCCAVLGIMLSWIPTRFSLILIACAALLAGAVPGNIPNSAGLKTGLASGDVRHRGEQIQRIHRSKRRAKPETYFWIVGVMHGGDALALRLAGYGRDVQLQSPGAPSLSNIGRRVEYRRGVLTEWYVNEASTL